MKGIEKLPVRQPILFLPGEKIYYGIGRRIFHRLKFTSDKESLEERILDFHIQRDQRKKIITAVLAYVPNRWILGELEKRNGKHYYRHLTKLVFAHYAPDHESNLRIPLRENTAVALNLPGTIYYACFGDKNPSPLRILRNRWE